jgi:hypothetical protein
MTGVGECDGDVFLRGKLFGVEAFLWNAISNQFNLRFIEAQLQRAPLERSAAATI